MPRTPIDYSKSCIYKICCKDTSITDIYVGSTTCMRRRKNQHKTNCNNEKRKAYNYNVYKFIREHGGWDNFDIVLVEKVNVNDGNELRKEERKWIEQLNATLNCSIPSRTRKEYKKEYYENNKDKIKDKSKENYENNKDKRAEKMKEYYENNKEKILEYHKEYHKNNKESKKEYYEKNKKLIAEKLKQKVECPICNSIITKQHLKRHQKSKKCLESQNKI